MTAQDRWRRIQRLCEELELLPQTERPARLLALEPDESLRHETLALLHALELEERHQREHSPAARVPDDLLPETIGGVRVEALIGSGGSGEVYRGRRSIQGVEQTVAVKRYHLHRTAPDDLARITREQRLLATLTHPGIVRFFDAGVTHGGRPFFVMELAEGLPVTRYADERHLPVPERIRLMLEACDALQSAHDLRIVHLDLKPSNIVVTAAGHVKLLDFGTAKYADPVLPPTQTEPLTLQYASPERLRGESVSPLCDVYSLGLILAELCAGHWPFKRRESLVAIAERAAGTAESAPLEAGATAEAAALRGTSVDQLRRHLRGDLDAIIHKAIAHDPSARYACAADLAADLRRYLGGHPVEARHATAARVTARFLRRHQVILLGLTAVAVTAALTTYVVRTANPPVSAGRAPQTHFGQTSMGSSTSRGVLMLDDVTPSVDITARSISWLGIYCAAVPGAPPPAPIASGFVLSLFADREGRPEIEAPLFRSHVPIARVDVTQRPGDRGHCGAAQTGITFERYHATLDTPLVAAAGRRYWLSIQAQVDRLDFARPGFVYWAWDGRPSEGHGSLQLVPTGAFNEFPADRAFELIE